MKASFFRIIRCLFLVSVFLFFIPQCKKDKKDQIPYVYVNFYINPGTTQYLALNTVGGWAYVTGGVRGIIIYRMSTEQFMAYERDCPYQPSNTCALVQVEKSGLIAIDSCCGSQFLITDGSVLKGPATIQLKQYETSYDGTNLHVFN